MHTKPLTVQQCERAVANVKAIKRLTKLRKHLAENEDWRLELQATNGDEEGGLIKFDTIMPDGLADYVLVPLIEKLRDELSQMGVVEPQDA